jgi:ferredoxin
MVAITEADCTGCDLCILHCPFEALLPRAHVLEHRRKRDVIVLMDRCVGCLSCIGSCPTSALFEVDMPTSARTSPLLETDPIIPQTEAIARWGPKDKPWA